VRPAVFFLALFALVAGPRAGLAQTTVPPPADEPVAPVPPLKALPTDQATGRLAGSWQTVARALKRGDVGEAQRLAAWLSSAQWHEALGTSTPEHLDTAIALLPSQVGAVAWLPVLGEWMLITQVDQQENVAKVLRATGTLLDGSSPAAAHEWDVPQGTLRSVCRGISWIASSAARPLETRLAALQALTNAQRLCGAAPTDLLVDPSPEIRRAAVPMVGNDPATKAALLSRLDDDSPAVESMAAARLCRETNASVPLPEVLRAARKFSMEPFAVEDSVDLLDCLARSPDDKVALEAVSQHGSKPLQQRANELLNRAP
jgi:hypothetical protein